MKLEKKAADEFGKALKDFKRAADLNPRLYQAYNGMGYSYRKLGDYTKALEYYDKALADGTRIPRSHRISRRSLPGAESRGRCEEGVPGAARQRSQPGGAR